MNSLGDHDLNLKEIDFHENFMDSSHGNTQKECIKRDSLYVSKWRTESEER